VVSIIGVSSIPFNRAALAGAELQYIQQAVDAMHLSGDGSFTARCHALLEQLLGVPRVLLTTSCTHALEMAALLLNLRDGDEVIVPSFTFVSTANAFVLRGAKPVFADVRPDTLNLDENRIEALLTDRTRAIVVVHYAGVACEMDTICRIAARRGIPVVEDNAHGLFGSYKGRQLGTIGELSTLSFHETKNITCGEGGALVLNRPEQVERAEVVREKGTNRTRFFRGEVDKYSWVDLGSSYLPSEILAAFLLAQLEAREDVQARRSRLWRRYFEGLRDWAPAHLVTLPSVPADCEHSAHLFYLLLPSPAARAALIAHLKLAGIDAVSHYVPLHLSPMGRLFGGRMGECPVTEDVSERLLRLPLSAGLQLDEQDRIIEAIRRAW
jgi:dTDP-4-amino-4,6-dideoxygalactose transaminase